MPKGEGERTITTSARHVARRVKWTVLKCSTKSAESFLGIADVSISGAWDAEVDISVSFYSIEN
jgi:hypothetical protein